nr:ATP-binding protein [Pseudanabaena sp. PCC 7367]
MTSNPKFPYKLLWSVLVICTIPFLLELAGVSFSTIGAPLDINALETDTRVEFIDALHHALSGSFTHTILEWSAFCTGAFTAALAFIQFALSGDVVTPIIGVALFYAGCMDAFHTLAADRLIQGVADNRSLIPFTWAICRLFSAVIMIAGTSLFLFTNRKEWKGNAWFIAIASTISGLIAYGIILICVKSNSLPQTMFPSAMITRPWDVAPLMLFLVGGIFVFPRFYQKYPSLFSLSLLIGVIPQVVTQLHMAFGSSALFDSNFNVAHFLKIIAYLVPFCGLCLNYIDINREKILAVEKLEYANGELETQVAQRIYAQRELQESNEALTESEKLLRDQTQYLQNTLNQLQKTQSQLVQTEKMSSLGQLVAGVAHEINNPVNFIYGNLVHANRYVTDLLGVLNLFQKHYPEPAAEIQAEIEAVELDFVEEDLPNLLNSMKVGADRIQKIVISLRNFSRMDEAEIKNVDIHEGIDSTLMILQNRLKAKSDHPEIKVVKEYNDLPRINCYAGQLNQVFMNILSNAIDAIEAENMERRSQGQPFKASLINISTIVNDDDRLQIRIADNGPGIPEQAKARLFDPFFTTKAVGKGTGLGLSISYQIVTEKHQGSLYCNSEPDQGTEFIIELPLQIA